MARFRDIVKNRNFSLLWVAQIISQFGDRLDQMALIALIYRFAPGSPTQMAKLMAFTIVPVFLVGPLAGVYVDRWDRRRTMIVCDILRGLLVFSIPFYFMKFDSMVPIYLVIFLVFSVSRFYVPAKMAIIPDLVHKDDLLLANSLVSITGMVAAMFGLGLGGLLVSAVGARGGFLIDGSTFLVSGFMIFFVSTKILKHLPRESFLKVGKEIADVIRKSVFSEMKEAFIFLGRERRLRSCFGILFLLWAALGAVYVVAIVFVQKVFGSATKEVGLLVVALGFGLFVGSLIYGRIGHKISAFFKVIFSCILMGGVVLSFFVLTSLKHVNVWLALGLALLLGFVVSPIMVIANTLVHELTDNSMRGKMFSALEIIVHLAFLLSMLVAAPMAERLGEVKVLLFVGYCLSVIGIVGLLRIYGRQIRRA